MSLSCSLLLTSSTKGSAVRNPRAGCGIVKLGMNCYSFLFIFRRGYRRKALECTCGVHLCSRVIF